ncbi:MAG: hypothetical protein IJ863_01580 [Spirochaetales bacterium]|nr:hypothetical protein [Spirochaetales bacterium]
MRSRCRRLAVALLSMMLALALLTGCSSFLSIIKSNFSGIPVWYFDPVMNTGKGNTGMVGEGHASTERQAELLAYSDIMDQLSIATGSELGQEAYRELSVLGTISQIGLSIEDRYTMTQEGQVTVLLHAVIEEDLLDLATSDETKRRAALSSEIESLVLEGDGYVKSGRELRAVSNYMKAMAKGIGEDYISSEYSFDELYDVVVELLDSMVMAVVNPRPSSATCTISMTRKGTFVSSAVAGAEVVATYTAVDTSGTEYRDSFVYLTDADGTFPFTSINGSLARSGSIEFSLNLSSELASLSAAPDQEKVRALSSLIASKSVVFSYSKTYTLGSLATAVIEHDILGYVTGSTDISDYIADMMKADGIEAAPFHAELDDELDVLYEFNHSGRSENCLLVIRIGLMDTVASDTGVVAASAEGLVSLYQCSTSKLLYQSNVIYSSAFGETEEDAIRSAFRKLADIAYTLVKAVYV